MPAPDGHAKIEQAKGGHSFEVYNRDGDLLATSPEPHKSRDDAMRAVGELIRVCGALQVLSEDEVAEGHDPYEAAERADRQAEEDAKAQRVAALEQELAALRGG